VAINKSGRLRMLSQRGAKAWLLLVQGVLPERAKSILAQSLASFEQILGELKTSSPVTTSAAWRRRSTRNGEPIAPCWPTSAPTPRRCGPTARPCSPLPRR
jgi:hypothetical protein